MSVAIIGASGKLGNATLQALLTEKLIPAKDVVCCTSSQPQSTTWSSLADTGAQVRHADFDDKPSLVAALAGVEKLFLVSTPKIELDYNNAAPGTGREKHHINAIEAARSAGVKHIYYSSLAFASPSKAGVMRAHIRTEDYLSKLKDIKYTVIREGLYNESWPLYLGYYFDIKGDERSEIIIAGDSEISWTAISDLGLGSALVLTAPAEEYASKTFYLSSTKAPKSLADIAQIVSDIKGKKITTKVVSRQAYEQFYVEEKQMPSPAVEWWSTTYDALRDGECKINDTTLERLLSSVDRSPKPVEETIREMIRS